MVFYESKKTTLVSAGPQLHVCGHENVQASEREVSIVIVKMSKKCILLIPIKFICLFQFSLL